MAQGFLVLEDLGDDLYTDVIAAGGNEARNVSSRHRGTGAASRPARAVRCFAADKPLFAYDETAMLAEVDLLTEWFLPLALGPRRAAPTRDEHRALWQRRACSDSDGARVFVHRDYHAQNLMWRAGQTGFARVGIVDFQDALAGAPAYDVVSLLEDARRDVAPELAER